MLLTRRQRSYDKKTATCDANLHETPDWVFTCVYAQTSSTAPARLLPSVLGLQSIKTQSFLYLSAQIPRAFYRSAV
jgi:hypothetical protein